MKHLCAAVLFFTFAGVASADLTVEVVGPDGKTLSTQTVPGPGSQKVVVEIVAATRPPEPASPAADFPSKVQAAYAADAATPSKLVRVRQLAACYRFAAIALAQNPDTVTEGQLHDQLVAVTATTLPAGALKGVRRAVADELAANLGADPSKRLQTQADRDAASAQFARIALILEGVK